MNSQKAPLFVLATLVFGFFILAMAMMMRVNKTNAELEALKTKIQELEYNVRNLKNQVEELQHKIPH